MLLSSLTFVKCEGLYFAQGFIHNLSPYFDSEFAQLGIISRTRYKFVQIATVVELYLNITHVKNKEPKKQQLQLCLPLRLADEKMSKKKEKVLNTL